MPTDSFPTGRHELSYSSLSLNSLICNESKHLSSVAVTGGGLFVLVYLCTTCVSGTLEGQKRVLDLLQLELQTVVSHQPHGCWELNLALEEQSVLALNC